MYKRQVELSKLCDVVPDPLVIGVEYVGSVHVYIDAPVSYTHLELPHVMLLVDDPIDRQKIDGCQGATQEDAVNIACLLYTSRCV